MDWNISYNLAMIIDVVFGRPVGTANLEGNLKIDLVHQTLKKQGWAMEDRRGRREEC